MGIISKNVEIVIGAKTLQYYKNLGYSCEHMGDKIVVDTNDLTHGSKIRVLVKCDFCGEEKLIMYRDYLKCVDSDGKYSCKKCCHNKTSNNKEKKTSHKQSLTKDEIKKKREETCYKKYGVPYVLQSKEVREKRRITMLTRYNTEIPAQVKEIRDKQSRTMIDRYGYPNSLQVEEFKKKYQDTLMKNYGVKNPSQSQEIRDKITNGFYRNGTQRCSSQQLFLFNLYSIDNAIELNYPISHYNVDICLLMEKICLEYDGSGHDLCIRLGKYTQEEFNHKELIRDKIIKSEGYKIMRIISLHDKLPSDSILLKMLSDARTYFQTTKHTWMTYDIDKSLLFNAENKNGAPYNFGALRTIKESDLQSDLQSNNDISDIKQTTTKKGA